MLLNLFLICTQSPKGPLNRLPGCTDYYPLLQPVRWILIPTCSHDRGLEFFIESLNSNFEGTLCDSWEKFTSGECDGNERASMGIALNSSVATNGSIRYGKYYMNVNAESPYHTAAGSRRNSVQSSVMERDGTPSITGLWGLAGAKDACKIAKFLKTVTFGLYDVTETEWYHDLMATAWQK